MNGKTGRRLRTVLFMAIATLVSVSAVSTVYLGTRERIQRNENLYRQRAIMRAAGLSVPAGDRQAAELFSRCAQKVAPAAGATPYYLVRDPDTRRLKAYVLPSQAPGLWGRISAVVGFAPDLKTLTGLEFTYQNETPGLGGKITEPRFKNQFGGKRGPFALRGGGKPDRTEVEAVTGATISTRAVLQLLNSAVERAGKDVRPVAKGGDR